MQKLIQDTHECFNCGEYIDWECEIVTEYLQVRRMNRTRAEAYLIAKNKFEMVVTCPICKLKNKFTYEV